MCRISNQLKLCTCHAGKARPRNYWVFQRPGKYNDIQMMGEPVMPAMIDPEDDAFNATLLQKLLNEGDVFDIDLKPRSKDRLQLSFYVNQPEEGSESNHIHYCFIYKRGKWCKHIYDLFEWEGEPEEEVMGQIVPCT
jgi:hypothetical protein